jgi:NAD(P)H-flavin reductase
MPVVLSAATSAGHADPMLPRIATVRRARRELADTVTLEIEPEDGPFAFLPGQFNMLTAFGVGESAISISGDPGRPEALVHTIRAVGAVSKALAALKPGARLGLRGPFGVGWPVEGAAGQDVVFLAGGLGLAPLRPAFYRVLAERERYGNVVLLFGTRTPTDILFRHEVEAWRKRLDLEVQVTVDHARDGWHGHVGVVTTLVPRADFDPLHATAFVCGPEVMMRFGATALIDAGIPTSSIHLSMERNMKCAVGLCGHCQFGPTFVCRDGPVFPYERVRGLLNVKEI